MTVDPPRPKETDAAVARPAACVILGRDGGGQELEVLLVKRSPAARVMGGVWVFPGGTLDEADGPGEEGHRRVAVRELAEEAGIGGVSPDSLSPFSRWITPAQLPARFDTRFFVAALPDDGEQARVDGRECVEHAWFAPQAALDAHADGGIDLVLPTIRLLEELRGFPNVARLIDHARARQVALRAE